MITNQNKLNYLFIVQGEGRGHMTQALALQDILIDAGQEVSAVMLGTNDRREVPAYFSENLKAPLHTYKSPNFVLDESDKALEVMRSIAHNVKNNREYFSSLKKVHTWVKQYNPDVIVNFFEPLVGLYYFLYRPGIPHYCIAHQLLAEHPEFCYAPGMRNKMLFKLLNKITTHKAEKKLALSFTRLSDLPERDLYIMPPLLRKNVLQHQSIEGEYLLVYLLNPGYATELVEWHSRHPDVWVHCFMDSPLHHLPHDHPQSLQFHPLNGDKFIEMMAKCRGVATSAGFETMCEAMYLGKPVMMIPTAEHYEQQCNALDAERAGAGIAASSFNLSTLLEYIPQHKPQQDGFKQWVARAPEMFSEILMR